MNRQDSPLGSDVYYIFLSLAPLPEHFRKQINLWQPSDKQIKVLYSKRLYEHLLAVLPTKQAGMLKNDYNTLLAQKQNQ